MVAVPEVVPLVTVPSVPTTATAVLLLVHVPPGIASLSVTVPPKQNEVVPVIGARGFIVTTVTAVHPVAVTR